VRVNHLDTRKPVAYFLGSVNASCWNLHLFTGVCSLGNIAKRGFFHADFSEYLCSYPDVITV